MPLPAIDLVLATVGRTDEPAALFRTLEEQTHRAFRVIVVDQNEDDRLVPLVAGLGERALHLRAPRGLARARNAGLAAVEAELVGFPDDDCSYPSDLLERIARRFAERPDLDGLTGRTADAQGRSSSRWGAEPRLLDRETVWHGGNSATTFLRAALVRRVGAFDETLGLGSGTRRASGEDTDYLVRALDTGARLEFDPGLVVVHALRARDDRSGAAGAREGAAVGYILGRHRYGARTVGRMLLRPAGGIAVAAARLDGRGVRFHGATLAGRVQGYLAGRAR